MNRRAFARGLVATPFIPALAQAQTSWRPDRPIRLIVGFAAGGATDTGGRVIAEAISGPLGQAVVVENRVGAAGNIGSEHVARSAPDGYTYVVASIGTHATNQFLYNNMGFHVVRDFTPVSLLVAGGAMVSVHPSVPVRSISELITYAKANPGKLNMGTSGPGSTQHFAGALFEQRAGVQFTHVPYRGGAPAMTDLVAGRLDILFAPMVETLPFSRSGQIRALGVTRPSRIASAPELPTIAETIPGFNFSSWLGIFGPAGLPEPIVRTMSTVISEAVRSPRTSARFEQLGYIPVGGTAQQMAELQRQDLVLMEELVRLTGSAPT